MMQKHSSSGPVERVHSAASQDDARWLVPGTIVWVVLINVTILSYAIYYVAQGASGRGLKHASMTAAFLVVTTLWKRDGDWAR